MLALAAVLVLAVALAGCGGGQSQQQGQQPGGQAGAEISGNLTAVGSTALQPLVEEAAKQFMAKNPKAQVTVQGGGSGTGLTQVASGAADIGNSDIFAEEKSGIDASQLKDHKVCVVGMAAVVNPGVKVDNLTKKQLQDIFTGKVTNWKEVGGPDQKITVIHRPKGSGTRATFKAFALDGVEETASGMEQESSGTVKKMVAETPGAISYLALSYIDNSIKAVKLDGVEPTVENIVTGKYPVWAYEHMYTKGEPTGLKKAFLDYMVSNDVQGTLVEKLGYIPITRMKVERDAQGKITQK
ncbi:phosphate ABC transporter substrate-binding protein PstS family protein [Desulfofundulus thermobenzoicus]|uniref:Phosphate-binding protein n=1 Tax=Desulfofundulus thermobenzoicus TaxID=29376 RepID=A0A6N7ITI5_9FIRM|nr:phosphate ABC transporter substrate-binding protein PstS family protein [Desulfofundulus thermobenzoicus]HHW42997.1 phosphate ABC transporter substrate-binding protein [Desulfotomaculum sp.]